MDKKSLLLAAAVHAQCAEAWRELIPTAETPYRRYCFCENMREQQDKAAHLAQQAQEVQP